MCVETAGLCHEQVRAMRRPTADMALFGMVWLLRVRSEMKRCAKCRRQEIQLEERASASTFFTIDAPSALPSADTASPAGPLAPTTYCEVHGYSLPKEDIQEFYELTLLDDTKSVQEKTAETIRIANKWETSDGPIAPYTNNDGGTTIPTVLHGQSASRENLSYIQTYVPSLWYYPKMDFLREHVSVRASKSNFDIPTQHSQVSQQSEESQIVQWEEDEGSQVLAEFVVMENNELAPVSPMSTEEVLHTTTPSTSSQLQQSKKGQLHTKKKPRSDEVEETEMLKQVTKDLGAVVSHLHQPVAAPSLNSNNTNKDADDVFGEFVAIQLREIKDRRKKADVIFKIHSVLHDVLSQQLE